MQTNGTRNAELVCSFKSLTQCQGHWWEVDAGSPSGTGWQRIEMRMQKWRRRNADKKWGRQNAADKTRMTKCGWQNADDKMRKGSCSCGWWNPYEGKWTFDVFLQFHLWNHLRVFRPRDVQYYYFKKQIRPCYEQFFFHLNINQVSWSFSNPTRDFIRYLLLK